MLFPSLISRRVSVDVKHHAFLLTYLLRVLRSVRTLVIPLQRENVMIERLWLC